MAASAIVPSLCPQLTWVAAAASGAHGKQVTPGPVPRAGQMGRAPGGQSKEAEAKWTCDSCFKGTLDIREPSGGLPKILWSIVNLCFPPTNPGLSFYSVPGHLAGI